MPKFPGWFLGAAILSGTIIGAGMFSLPFAFSKVGFLQGTLLLFLFGLFMSLTHLMYADVVVRNGRDAKFSSYAGKYLGRLTRTPVFLIDVLGVLLVLTIYIDLAPSFTRLAGLPMDNAAVSLAFWGIGSAFMFVGVKKLAGAESLITLCMFVIIALLSFLGLKEIFTGNRLFLADAPGLGVWDWLLPFGPLLFSLVGRTAIPSLVEGAGNGSNSLKNIKKAVWWGTFMPAFAYLLFAVGIFGLSQAVSPDAVSGIFRAAFSIRVLLGLLGLFAIWSTYIVMGEYLVKVLRRDSAFPFWAAAGAVVLVPLGLYLSGIDNFFWLVAFVGGVFLGAENIFVVLIWLKLRAVSGKGKLLPEMTFAPYILLFIFGLGIAYEITRALTGL